MTTARESIVLALIDRLKTISIANGYYTDLAAQVERHPDIVASTASFPVLVVKDGISSVSEAPHPFFTHTLTVTITVLSSSRWANSELSDVMADVIKAIGTDNTFGGLALGTTQITAADKVDLRQRENLGDAIVALEIDYRTPQWKM